LFEKRLWWKCFWFTVNLKSRWVPGRTEEFRLKLRTCKIDLGIEIFVCACGWLFGFCKALEVRTSFFSVPYSMVYQRGDWCFIMFYCLSILSFPCQRQFFQELLKHNFLTYHSRPRRSFNLKLGKTKEKRSNGGNIRDRRVMEMEGFAVLSNPQLKVLKPCASGKNKIWTSSNN